MNIVTHGFAYVPNSRHVIRWLLPQHDFGDKEPQAFGMISFTDSSPEHSNAIRQRFGHFGIEVSLDWAIQNEAQPVLYISHQGPVLETLRALFTRAYQEMKAAIIHPEDTFWTMSYSSRFVAGALGGTEYALMLRLYDFMEPAEHSFHREWRIVKRGPLSGYGQTTADVIKNVSPPKGWAIALNVLPIAADDIIAFHCPAAYQKALKNALPAAVRNTPIQEV